MPQKMRKISGIGVLSIIALLIYYTLWASFPSTARFEGQTLQLQKLGQELPLRATIIFAFIAASTNEDRNEVIRTNVDVLKNSTSRDYHVDCIIFSYSKYADQPDWLKQMGDDSRGYCRVVTLYQSSLVGFMKYLDPVFLASAGYDYVVISLDDVRLHRPDSNFNLREFFEFVLEFDLAVASPAIMGTVWAPLRPMAVAPRQVGHVVNAIELQSTTFRIDAWRCWWELSDTEFPSGWYDLFMNKYCFSQNAAGNHSMGVMDIQYAVHEKFPSTNTPSARIIFNKQLQSWKKDRGIDLNPIKPTVEGLLYRKDQI